MKRKVIILSCLCFCFAIACFLVTMSDNRGNTVEGAGYELFGISQDQLTFYHSGSQDMSVVDGALISTEDGEQKAMVKEEVFSSRTMVIEFSVTPATKDGELNHGVYFHAKDAQSGSQKIHALNVQIKREAGSEQYQIFLRSFLNAYIGDEQKTLKQSYDGSTINVKLLVDEEDIYLYLNGSDIPSMTKRLYNTEQVGTQIGFRSYNAAGTIDGIYVTSQARKPDVPTVKMLMIGNSFAVDAMAYVHELARADGINFIASVLYYGGGTLENHDDFITNRTKAYTLYKNGITDENNVGFYDAIYDEDWDIITFQSTSVTSGLYESWFPYIPKFLALAETLLPKAEVGLHMTWVSPYFMENQNDRKLANYNDSTDLAHEAVVATHERIREEHGVRFIVPTAVAMYNINETAICDPFHLSTSFCRDTTCHANEKGRYLLACTVYETIVGRSVKGNTFAPYGHTYGSDDGATESEREVIQEVVDDIFSVGGYESLYWFGRPEGISHIEATAYVTSYRAGQYFDYGNMEVWAYYEDGRMERTELYSIDLCRPLRVDDRYVTVSWQGKTAKVAITVT